MTKVDKGSESCDMPAVHEEKLKSVLVSAINKVIADKDTFEKKIVENIEKVIPSTEEKLGIDKIEARLKELQQELMRLVRLNANTGFDAEVYDWEYGRISKEIEGLRERKQRIQEAKIDDTIRKKKSGTDSKYYKGSGNSKGV